jgi:hypothetical protein
MDPNHWNDDRMQQWTFVVERQFGKNDAVRFNYIGTHAGNLEQRWAYNDPITLYNYRGETGLIGSTNPDDRIPIGIFRRYAMTGSRTAIRSRPSLSIGLRMD